MSFYIPSRLSYKQPLKIKKDQELSFSFNFVTKKKTEIQRLDTKKGCQEIDITEKIRMWCLYFNKKKSKHGKLSILPNSLKVHERCLTRCINTLIEFLQSGNVGFANVTAWRSARTTIFQCRSTHANWVSRGADTTSPAPSFFEKVMKLYQKLRFFLKICPTLLKIKVFVPNDVQFFYGPAFLL